MNILRPGLANIPPSRCPCKTVGPYQVDSLLIPAATGPREPTPWDCLSGDWVGASVSSTLRLRVALADLEGKVDAARPYHETLARHLSAPGTPLAWLEEVQAAWDGERFASVAVVEVDTVRHEYRLALAGHPEPLLRRPEGHAEPVGCPKLGLVGVNLKTTEGELPARPFPPGASLVLFSDGVLDAGVQTRGEAFGETRLRAAVASAAVGARLAPRILRAVRRHLAGAAPEDDLTIVVIAHRPAPVVSVTEVVRLAA